MTHVCASATSGDAAAEWADAGRRLRGHVQRFSCRMCRRCSCASRRCSYCMRQCSCSTRRVACRICRCRPSASQLHPGMQLPNGPMQRRNSAMQLILGGIHRCLDVAGFDSRPLHGTAWASCSCHIRRISCRMCRCRPSASRQYPGMQPPSVPMQLHDPGMQLPKVRIPAVPMQLPHPGMLLPSVPALRLGDEI